MLFAIRQPYFVTSVKNTIKWGCALPAGCARSGGGMLVMDVTCTCRFGLAIATRKQKDRGNPWYSVIESTGQSLKVSLE